ncbi:MAG: DUF1707 domain-containing protein [Nocardioidaceae bacterium]|nr:DUF1707 domain-containing protein [Nocardioidaceae bacterium]
MPTISDLRLSDADRGEAVSVLGQHHALGRLSLDEFNERVDAAYRAVTQSDLERLFADLPARTAVDAQPFRQPVTVPVGSCAASRQRWRGWLLISVVCLVVWAATSLGSGHVLYFWPIWVIGPWGMAMALTRLSTRPRAGSRT